MTGPEGGGYEQELNRQEKTTAWLHRLEEIEHIRDALGFPVDQNIRETIVALNLSGFPTSASCEGHIDRAKGAPWIKVEAPDRPHERFIGEDGIVEMIAAKYQVSPQDVRTSRSHAAWKEASKLASSNGETPEYERWRNENEALREILTSLVEEFYRGRSVDEATHLEIARDPEGTTRIHNGGEDFIKSSRDLTGDERRSLADRLPKYQAEMKAFTEFLKKRYFASQE
jgi:hypothetical protein